jgi:small-conductance mechanosensitive channel
MFHFTPEARTYIDNIYKMTFGMIVTAMVASAVNIVFREIKYSFGADHLIIRKFLPTLRFTTLLLIWIVWWFLILESLHINTDGLLAWAWIGWALFAIASRDIIANLLGSLSIILSKMFEIGDSIRVKWHEGVVEEITMSYTKIMNTEGKVVYIPNKIISIESLENLSRRRFYLYNFKVPFKKAIWQPDIVKDMLMLIEGKLSEYDPIDIKIYSEIPNANDFVYVFEVQMPEENRDFERKIRDYLVPFIFPKESK